MQKQKGIVTFKAANAPDGFILVYGLTKDTRDALAHRLGGGLTDYNKGFPVHLDKVATAIKVLTKWGIAIKKEEIDES